MTETEKIPDFILNAQLQQEIGKLNSYISELEDKIKTYEKLTPGEKTLIKKDQAYTKQKEYTTTLEKRIRTLEKDKERLIMRLNQQT